MPAPTPYTENILLTEVGQTTFLSLIEQGARANQACKLMQVPTRWLTEARREDPDFDERIILAQEESVADVLEVLKERALAGSTRDAEIFLKYTVLDQLQATRARDTRRVEVKTEERAEEVRTLDPAVVAEIQRAQRALAAGRHLLDAEVVEE
jgi:hypothetical protein